MKRNRLTILVLGGLLFGMGAAAWTYYQSLQSDSNDHIARWFNQPDNRSTLTTTRDNPCPDAPFLLPSHGFIGLLWRDPARPYNILRRHTGIDIFGDGAPGEVPIVAAYDGYLTRRPDWRSTVIIRHDDPLQPGRIIWTYYTHMADHSGQISYVSPAFPAGTEEVFVEQGTLLGFQGEYNGSGPAIGLHVHMSIVESESDGSFKNEAEIGNTIDPSPYFGLPLNVDSHPDRPIRCGESTLDE